VIENRAVSIAAWAVVAFLMAPLIVVVGGSFTESAYVAFPPQGFSLKWYAQLLERKDFFASFKESLVIGVAATLGAVGLGVPAAIGLSRGPFRGRAFLKAFVMSPLILPTVITGIALLQFYRTLDTDLPLLQIVIGHIVITVPYIVRTVGAGLQLLPANIEEAAESLGAGPIRTLVKVTLPSIAPSVLVGTIFVFIISFDQVTISIFLSSADAMPLPIRIYSYIEFAIDPMVAAVSTVLILFSYLLVVVLEKAFGLDQVFGGGTGR
jgi:putative spermidine/putrescine transport system permease protein